MPYREFRSRAGLTDLVACTWHRDAPTAGEAGATRVLPDACVDLVWRAGELFIAGPDREFVISPLDARGAITGLRLRPGTAGVVLGLPASELRGQRVPLDAVWGRDGTRLTERVSSAAGSPTLQGRLLEDAVLARRHEMAAPDSLVLAATRVLGATDAADGAGGRIGPLSREFATSERQMLRRFDAAVGYGPKMLDRVLRFQRFVSLVATASGRRLVLTHAAADLGYADQAHLSRECVRLSGLTPTQLIAEQSPPRDRVIVRE